MQILNEFLENKTDLPKESSNKKATNLILNTGKKVPSNRLIPIKDKIYGLIKLRSDFTGKSYNETYREFGITKDTLDLPVKSLMGVYASMVKKAKGWQ